MPPGGRRRTSPRPAKALVVLALTALAWAIPGALALAQCAMCKASLEGSADGIGASFNRAILVMLAGPYLVMGVFGVLLFRQRLREGGRRLATRLKRIALPGRGR
jgi:hypothetical protein